jgi:hypothetical protein
MATKKKAKAKAKKKAPSAKDVFATKKVVRLAKENPRRAGTDAHKKYAQMEGFHKRKPGATAREILDACSLYGTVDMRSDEAKGHIKLVGA